MVPGALADLETEAAPKAALEIDAEPEDWGTLELELAAEKEALTTEALGAAMPEATGAEAFGAAEPEATGEEALAEAEGAADETTAESMPASAPER